MKLLRVKTYLHCFLRGLLLEECNHDMTNVLVPQHANARLHSTDGTNIFALGCAWMAVVIQCFGDCLACALAAISGLVGRSVTFL